MPEGKRDSERWKQLALTERRELEGEQKSRNKDFHQQKEQQLKQTKNILEGPRHLGEMVDKWRFEKKKGLGLGTPASHWAQNLAATLQMTSHDAPEYTDLHTRLAGASEPEYSKLPPDITTAGVNLAGLRLPLNTCTQMCTHVYSHIHTHMATQLCSTIMVTSICFLYILCMCFYQAVFLI